MTDGERPFGLEDDGPPPPRKMPPPPPPEPEDEGPEPATPPRRGAPELDVDRRTVRERLGTEDLPDRPPDEDPAGWPLEALRYPLRRPIRTLGIAAAAWTLADLLGRTNVFVAALLKLPLAVALLRLQMRAALATADGKDSPPPAFVASDLQPEALADVFRVVLRLFLFLLPAGFTVLGTLMASPSDPDFGGSKGLLAGSLALAGLLFAPIALLGIAFGRRSWTWPWGGLVPLARGLVPCVTTVLGWCAAVLAERLVARMYGAPVALFVIGSLGLRLAVVAWQLVGARGLGVLARRSGP